MQLAKISRLEAPEMCLTRTSLRGVASLNGDMLYFDERRRNSSAPPRRTATSSTSIPGRRTIKDMRRPSGSRQLTIHVRAYSAERWLESPADL